MSRSELRKMDWTVITVWECQILRSFERSVRTIIRIDFRQIEEHPVPSKLTLSHCL